MGLHVDIMHRSPDMQALTPPSAPPPGPPMVVQHAWPDSPQGPQLPVMCMPAFRPLQPRPVEQVPLFPVPQHGWPLPPQAPGAEGYAGNPTRKSLPGVQTGANWNKEKDTQWLWATYPWVTDAEVLDAFQLLARTEGIIPAIESSHALAGAIKLGAELGEIVLINLSGRGDKDMDTAARYFDLVGE